MAIDNNNNNKVDGDAAVVDESNNNMMMMTSMEEQQQRRQEELAEEEVDIIDDDNISSSRTRRSERVMQDMHFLTAMAALGGFLFGYDTYVYCIVHCLVLDLLLNPNETNLFFSSFHALYSHFYAAFPLKKTYCDAFC